MRDDIRKSLQLNKETSKFTTAFGFKGMLKGIENHLKQNEIVEYIKGHNVSLNPESEVKPNAFRFSKKTAVLVVVTNERLIFYRRIFPNEHLEQIPVHDIRSVDVKKDMYSSIVRVTALRKTIDIDSSVDVKEYSLLTNTLDTVMSRKVETVTNQVSMPESKEDAVKALKELANLRDDGIISNKEFEKKKIELLAKI